MIGTITRNKGKRLHNRQEVDKLNRKALYIWGVAAGSILALIVFSFLSS